MYASMSVKAKKLLKMTVETYLKHSCRAWIGLDLEMCEKCFNNSEKQWRRHRCSLGTEKRWAEDKHANIQNMNEWIAQHVEGAVSNEDIRKWAKGQEKLIEMTDEDPL